MLIVVIILSVWSSLVIAAPHPRQFVNCVPPVCSLAILTRMLCNKSLKTFVTMTHRLTNASSRKHSSILRRTALQRFGFITHTHTNRTNTHIHTHTHIHIHTYTHTYTHSDSYRLYLSVNAKWLPSFSVCKVIRKCWVRRSRSWGRRKNKGQSISMPWISWNVLKSFKRKFKTRTNWDWKRLRILLYDYHRHHHRHRHHRRHISNRYLWKKWWIALLVAILRHFMRPIQWSFSALPNVSWRQKVESWRRPLPREINVYVTITIIIITIASKPSISPSPWTRHSESLLSPYKGTCETSSGYGSARSRPVDLWWQV